MMFEEYSAIVGFVGLKLTETQDLAGRFKFNDLLTRRSLNSNSQPHSDLVTLYSSPPISLALSALFIPSAIIQSKMLPPQTKKTKATKPVGTSPRTRNQKAPPYHDLTPIPNMPYRDDTACKIWWAKDHPLYQPDEKHKFRTNAYVIVLSASPDKMEELVRRGASAIPPAGPRQEVEDAGE